MKKLFTISIMVLIAVLSVVMIAEAITVTINRNFGDANSEQRIRDVTIAMDSSYPTGGEALAASSLALVTVYHVSCDINDGYLFQYDYTNSKLLAFGATTGYQGNISEVTKPALTLTHTADAGSTQAALPLYAVEANGVGPENILSLQSTTNGNTSILASFEETTGDIAPGTPRYWVEDSNTPSGVIVYVNTTGDILEFVSPTETDGYIISPVEAIADTVPGFALKIKVHHSATAATGSILYFDDNGAADTQLFFTDPGAAGGVIPAADIEVIGISYNTASISGPLSQMLDTTDLSAITDLKCRVIGSHR